MRKVKVAFKGFILNAIKRPYRVKLGIEIAINAFLVTRKSIEHRLEQNMSDKFFFKGRQDARENHVKNGYKTKAVQKLGTKKYPLSLLVTSKERKQEVENMASEAGLYADVTIDSSDRAEESIAALTALLNKKGTVTLDQTPARNEPCSCGSGKKYKKCCG